MILFLPSAFLACIPHENPPANCHQWFDDDADGYGGPYPAPDHCGPKFGIATNDDDCDDQISTVHPGAKERCDDVDNDCNGLVDFDDPQLIGGAVWRVDPEAHQPPIYKIGLEACERPKGYVLSTDLNVDQRQSTIQRKGAVKPPQVTK